MNNLAAQYQVIDGEENGRVGSYVRHISESENTGRFIPDGERCNLCQESVAMTMCRHNIAKCKHKKIPIFDCASIDPVHLFRTITPRVKVDGTFVATVARGGSEHTATSVILQASSPRCAP